MRTPKRKSARWFSVLLFIFMLWSLLLPARPALGQVHEYDVYSRSGDSTTPVGPPNGGFETGDLAGWRTDYNWSGGQGPAAGHVWEVKVGPEYAHSGKFGCRVYNANNPWWSGAWLISDDFTDTSAGYSMWLKLAGGCSTYWSGVVVGIVDVASGRGIRYEGNVSGSAWHHGSTIDGYFKLTPGQWQECRFDFVKDFKAKYGTPPGSLRRIYVNAYQDTDSCDVYVDDIKGYGDISETPGEGGTAGAADLVWVQPEYTVEYPPGQSKPKYYLTVGWKPFDVSWSASGTGEPTVMEWPGTTYAAGDGKGHVLLFHQAGGFDNCEQWVKAYTYRATGSDQPIFPSLVFTNWGYRVSWFEYEGYYEGDIWKERYYYKGSAVVPALWRKVGETTWWTEADPGNAHRAPIYEEVSQGYYSFRIPVVPGKTYTVLVEPLRIMLHTPLEAEQYDGYATPISPIFAQEGIPFVQLQILYADPPRWYYGLASLGAVNATGNLTGNTLGEQHLPPDPNSVDEWQSAYCYHGPDAPVGIWNDTIPLDVLDFPYWWAGVPSPDWSGPPYPVCGTVGYLKDRLQDDAAHKWSEFGACGPPVGTWGICYTYVPKEDQAESFGIVATEPDNGQFDISPDATNWVGLRFNKLIRSGGGAITLRRVDVWKKEEDYSWNGVRYNTRVLRWTTSDKNFIKSVEPHDVVLNLYLSSLDQGKNWYALTVPKDAVLSEANKTLGHDFRLFFGTFASPTSAPLP